LRNAINKIETILITNFRPSFLVVTQNADSNFPYIHVILSAKVFNKKTVDQRVANVFNCLLKKDKDLVEKNTIIVEAFTSSEMADIFEYIKG
jgi:hypothetical protein